TPGGLHVDIQDDRFGPELQVVNAGPRPWKYRSELDAGTANDGRWHAIVLRDPRQVFPARQGLLQVRGGCALQSFLVVGCELSHVPKHRNAVVCEERNIAHVGLADDEGWFRTGHCWNASYLLAARCEDQSIAAADSARSATRLSLANERRTSRFLRSLV